MLWTRKLPPIHDRSRVVGIDLTASRARAVSVGGGKVRPLPLDDAADDLALYLACDRRTPEAGRAGVALARKAPHSVVSNFLAGIGQPGEFRAGRHVLTPEAALELVAAKFREPVAAESDAAALVLPPYLAAYQVARVVAVAARVKLPLKGSAAAPLAVAAHRAAAVLDGKPAPAADAPAGDVLKMRPPAGGPAAVVVVDADDFALTTAVVAVDRDAVRLGAVGCWPRVGVRVWKDRLLDALADRCVRLCRRDPRDSADAEQGMYDQLDDALDRARAGQRVSLSVRTAHWFQDLIQSPEEFDANCAALAAAAAEAVWELVAGAGLRVPPRVVWLTHAAGRLPGLARLIHQNAPEGIAVEVLPAGAVAHAAAALVPRWLANDLPRAHLDSVIALERVAAPAGRVPGEKPGTARGAT